LRESSPSPAYTGIWARKVRPAITTITHSRPPHHIPYSHPHSGWRFATSDESLPGENVTSDPLNPQHTHLRDIYFSVSPDYSGRFTVPTLYDKKLQTIVSNESSEIIRMFYHAFDKLLPSKYASIDLLPSDLESSIDAANEWTYTDINNGVYRSGFATTQDAYTTAVTTLFKSLDRTEKHLASQSASGPFYFGDKLTEADVRLYTTIIRFDVVYVQHFKTNLRDIRSGYPYLHKWVRNLYWNHEAFGSTTEFEHIKNHYTKSHPQINPFGITPVGPVPDILGLEEEVAAVKGTK
jgi:glutathionyl-hydroquinone reductase